MIGLAGMLVALFLPIEQYTSFLLLIGSLFIPLFGVVVTDYVFVKRRRYSTEDLYRNSGNYWYHRGVSRLAIGAWFIEALSYHVIVTYSSWLGASVPSFIMAAFTYWIAMELKK